MISDSAKEARTAVTDYTRSYDSPLGRILLASDGDALTGLRFDERPSGAAQNRLCAGPEPPVIAETIRWLDLYFSGNAPDFTPKLNLRTTPFRKAVWETLLTVPYGKTVTYGEIAGRIARRTRVSARAVGGAAGHNAVLLIIPCHRVVGANGSLTGYAGGLERKWRLLEMEKADTGRLFIPEK